VGRVGKGDYKEKSEKGRKGKAKKDARQICFLPRAALCVTAHALGESISTDNQTVKWRLTDANYPVLSSSHEVHSRQLPRQTAGLDESATVAAVFVQD